MTEKGAGLFPPTSADPGIAAPRDSSVSEVPDRILCVATELFLQKGYAGASIDQISSLARCSKRTVYDRFLSKERLFKAVISRFGEELVRRARQSTEPFDNIENALIRLGDRMVELSVAPDTVRLYQLIVSECGKLEGIAALIEAVAWRPAMQMVCEVLAEHERRAAISLEDKDFLAKQYVSLVTAQVRLRSSLGEVLIASDFRPHVRRSVHLFVAGLQGFKTIAAEETP